MLWAKAGERAIDWVNLAAPALADDGTSLGGSQSAGAVFARSRQAARHGKLRVGEDGGAGLDMEASRWGYLVEDVDEDPGQPDIAVGDCILSIGGQALHGLSEEVMHWRFGRNFSDGVEVTILPAEQVRAILAADKPGAAAKADASKGTAVTRGGDPLKKQHFVFSARLEAWCVASVRDPPRLVAVTDNRLVLADLTDDSAMTRQAFAGVAKAPWKRPVERVALLDETSDVLLAGVAKGVLVWRVPMLAADFNGKPPSTEEQLLMSVPVPGRCNLVGACMGLSCGSTQWGWIAGDVSGVGSDPGGSFDVWQVFSGRHRPLLELVGQGPSDGSKPGLAGDSLSRAFATVGVAADAMGSAVKASIALKGASSQTLPSWISSLQQNQSEPVYVSVDKAESVFAEAVRDLRRWLRAEGRRASFVRQDGARSLIQWIEDCRRYIIWPLQVAFQAEASDSGDDDLPTRPTSSANMRSTGAAAGTTPNAQ